VVRKPLHASAESVDARGRRRRRSHEASSAIPHTLATRRPLKSFPVHVSISTVSYRPSQRWLESQSSFPESCSTLIGPSSSTLHRLSMWTADRLRSIVDRLKREGLFTASRRRLPHSADLRVFTADVRRLFPKLAKASRSGDRLHPTPRPSRPSRSERSSSDPRRRA